MDMAARGVTLIADPCLLWDRVDVDVLVPQSTEEYIEFNRALMNEPPDYIFQIPDISNWVTRVAKFDGQKFQLRNSPYQAQIHCSISFSDIGLFISVHPQPGCEKLEENVHVQLAAIVKQYRSTAVDNIVLAGSVRAQAGSQRYAKFGRFTYTDKLKNPGDKLSIVLYAKNVWDKIASGVVRWKVDCSHMDLTDELGLTPWFYARPAAVMVQARLFVRDEHMTAEFRFIQGSNKEKFSVHLHVVNPRDQRLNITRALKFEEWYKPELEEESSTTSVISKMESLKDFFINNKLMVKVELVYNGGKDDDDALSTSAV